MTDRREITCVSIGKRGDDFFATIQIDGITLETFKLRPIVYWAMIEQAVQSLSSESLQNLRAKMIDGEKGDSPLR